MQIQILKISLNYSIRISILSCELLTSAMVGPSCRDNQKVEGCLSLNFYCVALLAICNQTNPTVNPDLH